ncbi:nuclear transport factor 2 family protein [Cellulomonas fimi]|uniref:nuclear transport factor 2 family protein n=1 Tax=Cellulomonas fimi TaxID=1708 RepID=UPI00235917F1|nr:nuclear transport factor 2 family protein [Cellulomonas fimi]
MDVMTWVDGYERAWRGNDVAGLGQLFTDDVRYLRSAYDDGLTGIDAVREFWPDDSAFTMHAAPVAVQGDTAVVRVDVQYGGDEPHEYRDLWILRFAGDGRVRHFEEWAHWPGMPGWNPAAE